MFDKLISLERPEQISIFTESISDRLITTHAIASDVPPVGIRRMCLGFIPERLEALGLDSDEG